MTTSDKPTVRTEFMRPVLPEAARKACERPVVIPKRALTEKDVVSLWGRDRKELVVCESRRKAAVDAVAGAVP